jgi:hypothetical protein
VKERPASATERAVANLLVDPTASESVRQKSFTKKMTNHVSLLLEAAAARKRLAQLFQSEPGRGNRLSTAIVASGLSHTVRTDTQQNKPLLQDARRWLFIMPQDWTWWAWLVTACLLLIGLLGMPEAFFTALLLSIAQSVLFFARKRALGAFPVQLRLAYTLLLIICFFLPIRWLFWLPAVGTFALVIFGYCLMARMLSLLPWNRTEPITADLVRRTFLSRPDHWIGQIVSLRPDVESAYAPLRHR